MRVCVTTYCTWSSFGSMLQSLGLKKTLSDLGAESFFVSDCSASYIEPKIKTTGNIARNVILYFLDTLIKKDRKRSCDKGNDFIKKHINWTYYPDFVKKYHDMSFDAYITGSDQVWHPWNCNGIFFLDFAPKSAKRISYAASMGVTEIPEDKKAAFTKLLNNIETISVREQEVKDVLGSYTDKNIEVHIDPTFLLSADEWKRYESRYDLKKGYILLYAIYWDKKFNEQVKRLHKRTGLPVVAVCGRVSRCYCNKRLYDVGPAEFLWLVDNADYVITSSFHGVAFSTIFNKKFSAVINPSSPSRIASLMKLLHIPQTAINDLDSFDDIDHDIINDRIEEERNRSIGYLKRELDL